LLLEPQFASVLGAWLFAALLLAPRNLQSLRLRRPSHIVFYTHSNGAHSIISPYPNPNLVLDRAIYSINVRCGRQAYTRLNTPVEAIVVTGTPLLGLLKSTVILRTPPRVLLRHSAHAAAGSSGHLHLRKGAATPEFGARA
jgi:hypothetical protein